MKAGLRLSAALLSVAILSALLSACDAPAAGTEATRPPSGVVMPFAEPQRFSMLYSNEAYAPYSKDWPILEEIKKRTNVTVELVIVPDVDYKDKLALLVNTGDMPDILTRLWPSSYDDLCVGGRTFLPVGDYMELLPNFRRLMGQWDLKREYDSYVLSDGKFYWLPGLNEKPVYNAGFIIRRDLLDQSGLQMGDYYDLKSFLAAYKQKNPDSLPLTGCGLDCFLSFIGFGWGVQAGWNSPHGVYYDYDLKEFRMLMASAKYKDMISYLAGLMLDGLLDPEIATQDMETFKQKLATGRSIATWYYVEPVEGLNNSGRQSSPDFNLTLQPPIAGPAGAFTQNTNSRFSSGWMLPASVAAEPDFEELMAFADWLAYGDDGVTLMTWGIEGVTYSTVDGKKEFTDAVRQSGEGISRTLQSKFGVNSNSITVTRPMDYMLAILDDGLKPVALEVSTRGMDNPMVPVVQFTDDEKERLELIKAALLPYCREMELQFLYGKRSLETDWDDFIETAGKMGRQELEELFNTALRRLNK